MNYVSRKYDIVVVGAGPGGLGASIAAARGGAKVLLVEKNGYLGGNMAMGLPLLAFMDWDKKRVIGGIAEELMARMRATKTPYGKAASEHQYCPHHGSVTLYDHELFKITALHAVLEAGVEILTHAEVASANVDCGKLKSIRIRGKGYEMDVYAKVFIDGTGDGDVAYLAGATYQKGQADTGLIQPPTMMFTLAGVNMDETIDFLQEHPEEMEFDENIHYASEYNAEFFRNNPEYVMVGMRHLFSKLRSEGKMPVDRDTIIVIKSLLPGEVHMNCTRHLGTDGSDMFSVTKAEIEGYFQVEKFVDTLRLYIPGFENCYITQIYPSLGIRESRRFSAIRILTGDDLVNGVIDDETIALGSYCVDIHSGDTDGTIFTKVPVYGLPYGITVSDEVEGLMFAGRCAGMDAVAMSSARVMPICMAMGEGAGTAAALAVKQGISPAKIDVAEVRKILLQNNGILTLEGRKDQGC